MENGSTWLRLPVSSKQITARVTVSRVTPHIVAPAATMAYTPGVTHASVPGTDGQLAKRKKSGYITVKYCAIWPTIRPIRPPTTMDGM